jgi:hypothetical protein
MIKIRCWKCNLMASIIPWALWLHVVAIFQLTLTLWWRVNWHKIRLFQYDFTLSCTRDLW